jgi:hypothetical protein
MGIVYAIEARPGCPCNEEDAIHACKTLAFSRHDVI